MVSPTPNKGMTYPAHGGAVNAWDSPLNANFDQLDLNLGGYYPVTVTSTATTANYNSTSAILSSTVAVATFPSSLAQNLYYNVTGALTQDLTLTFPAVGSLYEIANNTSGAFTVTAVTAASTSAGSIIPQGTRSSVVTDGTNLLLANTAAAAAEFYTYFGSPQGNVAGTVATVNGANTDAVWDATDQQLYLVTTTGSSVTAIWTPQIARVIPQGYLTLTNSTTAPIISADTTSTVVYYTPLVGNWVVLSNGTTTYPYQFSQMQLTLTATQAASTIYDIFIFLNAAGTPVIGSGVAWTTSTAGSGNRGSGAGTAQLSRLNGIWTNAVAQNMTWNTGSGNTTVAVGANQGVYLGSIYVDATAGQVTCHRAFGQNRKFGVWNLYNRQKIIIQAGDSTASWTYGTSAYRASNNTPAVYASASFNVGSGTICNGINVFCGLPEEEAVASFGQTMSQSNSGVLNLAIGVNSISVQSGRATQVAGFTSLTSTVYYDATAKYILVPSLGLNIIVPLEKSASTTGTFYGTTGGMLLNVEYNG